MNEATLKGALVNLARMTMKGYVVIRHEDRFTHGVPDISFTGDKKTVWAEVKYADPGFEVKGIQELTMRRLALAGHALFVVYYEKGNEKITYLVHPDDIGKDRSEWGWSHPGFNHQWVLDAIRGRT